MTGAAAIVGSPRRQFTWNALLWSLVFPQRAHRILPTIPGTVLIALSLGIGMAAYNSSSNILFLTLALLLTCLVLSGVLSWLNLRRIEWRLRVPPVLRAGHDTLIAVELRNAKAFLPTYGLWFNFAAHRRAAPREQRAESTITARGIDVRAVLARADASEIRGRVALSGRLDPGNAAEIQWIFQPTTRGVLHVGLASVGSLFPFGFLRKDVGTDLASDVVVWPAPIEYRRFAPASAQRYAGDERIPRAGSGTDLLAVRRYTSGDSHRLIHWKASARTGQLLVRQFAAEITEGYTVWLRTDAGIWPRADQFETLISFAATLAEDLYRAGRLLGAVIDERPLISIRRIHDLELLLNELALLQPGTDAAVKSRSSGAEHNIVTFSPEGARGVVASANGETIASV